MSVVPPLMVLIAPPVVGANVRLAKVSVPGDVDGGGGPGEGHRPAVGNERSTGVYEPADTARLAVVLVKLPPMRVNPPLTVIAALLPTKDPSAWVNPEAPTVVVTDACVIVPV